MIPPVAQGLIAILLILVLSRYAPLYYLNFDYQKIVAGVLTGAGAGVALSGVLAFGKLSTTVDPRYPEQASELVIIGIYKYSRNPMYLGILLVLIGIAVFFGALSSVFIIYLFVIYINKFQIVPEEMALQEKFGGRYTQYARNVRRWM